MGTRSADGSDSMAKIEHFVSGQDIGALVTQISWSCFPEIDNTIIYRRQICRRDDRPNAFQLFSGPRINRENAGMGVWTAQNLCKQHIRKANIRTVLRLSRDLVGSIVATETFANNPVSVSTTSRSAGAVFSIIPIPHTFCCIQYSAYDFVITGTAAEVACQPQTHIMLSRLDMIKQCLRCNNQTRGANSALQRRVGEKLLLSWGEDDHSVRYPRLS